MNDAEKCWTKIYMLRRNRSDKKPVWKSVTEGKLSMGIGKDIVGFQRRIVGNNDFNCRSDASSSAFRINCKQKNDFNMLKHPQQTRNPKTIFWIEPKGCSFFRFVLLQWYSAICQKKWVMGSLEFQQWYYFCVLVLLCRTKRNAQMCKSENRKPYEKYESKIVIVIHPQEWEESAYSWNIVKFIYWNSKSQTR